MLPGDMETEKPSFQDKQKRIACFTSQGLAILMAAGDLAMLWVLWVIAAKIQHRHSPPVPPSVVWFGAAYVLGIAGLVGSVLWGRSHLTRNLLEQPGEFIRQTQISLTLGFVCFCAAPIWVFLGGLWI